jgi:hydrogenase maturation protein HypF
LYGDAALEMDDLAPIRDLRRAERKVLAQMLARDVNAPITTSAGRLFDGIAALIGLHGAVSFEGQAAMALEFTADGREMGAYPVALSHQSSVVSRQSSVLDWQPLMAALLADLRRGVSQGIIAARFHNALVEGIVGVAQRVGAARVALTGGCFQNRWLTARAADRLQRAGFEVLLHRHVPPNDGGISLGQVAVAAAKLNDER